MFACRLCAAGKINEAVAVLKDAEHSSIMSPGVRATQLFHHARALATRQSGNDLVEALTRLEYAVALSPALCVKVSLVIACHRMNSAATMTTLSCVHTKVCMPIYHLRKSSYCWQLELSL